MKWLKATRWCIKLADMKALLNRQFLLLTLTVLSIFAASGCATTEDDNLTERPWNTPKTWETGIPQGMMQGR
jgi:hypothetical protein